MRILIVDDDDLFRNAISRRLPGHWDVTRSSSGHHALKLMGMLGGWDVVLSDLEMPRMDGIAFLGAVMARWPRIRRILMSSHPATEERVQGALASGIAEAFWSKTDPRDALIAAVFADDDENGSVDEQEPVQEPPTAVHESQPPEPAEPGSGLLATLPIPAEVQGRLTRSEVQGRMIDVIEAFVERYNWETDLKWFVAAAKSRGVTDRETEWYKESRESLHRWLTKRRNK